MKWDWQVFLQDTGGGQTYLEWLMSAWGWTLSVALCALVVALLVGSLMGILRTVPNKWLVLLGNSWTELFRNIPLLVQIFLWYHVLPSLIKPLQAFPSFVLVVFALGFFTSARISDVIADSLSGAYPVTSAHVFAAASPSAVTSRSARQVPSLPGTRKRKASKARRARPYSGS